MGTASFENGCGSARELLQPLQPGKNPFPMDLYMYVVYCPDSCAHQRQLHPDGLPHPDPRAVPGPAGEE